MSQGSPEGSGCSGQGPFAGRCSEEAKAVEQARHREDSGANIDNFVLRFKRRLAHCAPSKVSMSIKTACLMASEPVFIPQMSSHASWMLGYLPFLSFANSCHKLDI